MVSRKENKMNLLQTLWSWLTSLFAKAPALVEEDCCEEVCEIEEETLPELVTEEVEELPEPEPVEEIVESPVVSALVGELLREILLSEGISENVIGKYQIIETFEGWYDGPIDNASVRASIQDFKSSQGGAINAKLSRVK
jgi:hypothetical protein